MESSDCVMLRQLDKFWNGLTDAGRFFVTLGLLILLIVGLGVLGVVFGGNGDDESVADVQTTVESDSEQDVPDHRGTIDVKRNGDPVLEMEAPIFNVLTSIASNDSIIHIAQDRVTNCEYFVIEREGSVTMSPRYEAGHTVKGCDAVLEQPDDNRSKLH